MLADDEMYGAQPVVGFDDRAAAVATVQKFDVGAMHDKVVRPLRVLTRSFFVGLSVSQVPLATALQLGAIRCSGGAFALPIGPARSVPRTAAPQTGADVSTSSALVLVSNASRMRLGAHCRSMS